MAHSQQLSGMRPSAAVDRLEPHPVSVRSGGEKHQCLGIFAGQELWVGARLYVSQEKLTEECLD